MSPAGTDPALARADCIIGTLQLRCMLASHLVLTPRQQAHPASMQQPHPLLNTNAPVLGTAAKRSVNCVPNCLECCWAAALLLHSLQHLALCPPSQLVSAEHHLHCQANLKQQHIHATVTVMTATHLTSNLTFF